MGRLLVTLAAALLLASAAPAATFTVDSTGDASDASAGNGTCATAGAVCTLRAAIEEANALSGADTINFGISGSGPHTITAATSLPAVSEQVAINCASQTGTVLCSGLDCSSAVWKIKISRGGGTNGGIDVSTGATSSTINGCEVADVAGSDTSGYGIILRAANSVATGNNVHDSWGGIVSIGNSAVIGGIGSDDANWAHANNFGLTVTGTGSIVNNIVGTTADGSAADGNTSYGIYVEGGTSNITSGNLSSGNGGRGIYIKTGVTSASVTSNVVGRNRTDTADLCNRVGDQIEDNGTTSSITGNTEGTCPVYHGCMLADGTNAGHPGATCFDDTFADSISPGDTVATLDSCAGIASALSTTVTAACLTECTVPGDPDSSCSAPPTATPTSTRTATPASTATVTDTPTAAPTVADSTGMCRATGDKESPASALVLTNTSATIATLDFTVDQAEDPWFFLCNVVVQNQANHAVRATFTLSEAGGLFSPQTQTVDVSGSALVTYQIPFQTWNITPGTYQLSCAANVNKKNALIVQTTSYVGAWRLGSSAGGCPVSDNGLGTQVCVDTTVATSVTPALTVPTPLPAGAILDTCLTETSVAVTGGYSVGFAGAPEAFGSVDGTLASTNRLDATLASPARLPAADNLLLTSTHSSGSFANTTGRIHALCYCRNLTMPTATPTP